MTPIQKAGAVLGVVISLGTIGTASIGFVNTIVAEAVAAEAATREERDYETQLELVNVQIKRLTSKALLNTDEEEELNYLRERRRIILERLAEMKK
jgi:hypothetical protein